jgi:hypothetical protein
MSNPLVENLKNNIIYIYNYLEKNHNDLLNVCYKLDTYEELNFVLKEFSEKHGHDNFVTMFLFEGEVKGCDDKLENIGIPSIKYLIKKNREFMNKQVVFEDMMIILKHKNDIIKNLTEKLEKSKTTSGLILPLDVNNFPPLPSQVTSPVVTTPVSPSNAYEYNPFIKNVWK